MNQSQKELYQKRYGKLLEMISNYSLTQQQSDYLQKIKEETELEIAIRFLKSQSNKNYIFPLNVTEQEDQIQEFPGRVSFQQTFYDLCDQNYLPSKQKISKETTSRRVKSLGPQKALQHHNKNRLTSRVPVQRENNHQRLKLPKIQSSKIVLKSLEKQPLSSIQEKKTLRVKLSKNKNASKQMQRQSDYFGVLLTKKLLTQQEETVQIGATKILLNKRIHSPVKVFNKNLKHTQKGSQNKRQAW